MGDLIRFPETHSDTHERSTPRRVDVSIDWQADGMPFIGGIDADGWTLVVEALERQGDSSVKHKLTLAAAKACEMALLQIEGSNIS